MSLGRRYATIRSRFLVEYSGPTGVGGTYIFRIPIAVGQRGGAGRRWSSIPAYTVVARHEWQQLFSPVAADRWMVSLRHPSTNRYEGVQFRVPSIRQRGLSLKASGVSFLREAASRYLVRVSWRLSTSFRYAYRRRGRFYERENCCGRIRKTWSTYGGLFRRRRGSTS